MLVADGWWFEEGCESSSCERHCSRTECYEEALFVTQLQNEHKISFMSSLRAYKSTYGMLLELAS